MSAHPPKVVFVDVDDTLIRSVGRKRIPNPAVLAYVRELHATGAQLFCWSSGGADYAIEVATELALAHCFTAFLPKPTLILDDQPVADWRYCTHLHPANC